MAITHVMHIFNDSDYEVVYLQVTYFLFCDIYVCDDEKKDLEKEISYNYFIYFFHFCMTVPDRFS